MENKISSAWHSSEGPGGTDNWQVIQTTCKPGKS